ncbi:hypothetical protein LguiB_034704 [Lonicera macranthoides]
MGEFGVVEVQNVSTELKLFDKSWLNNTEEHQRAERIRRFGEYTHDEEEEEMRLGILTKLKLEALDPWEFKKVLMKSDCNILCRLMVPKREVRKIYEKWDPKTIKKIESGKGEEFKVRDYDTETDHSLIFEKLLSSKSYVFNKNWSRDFMRRRELKEGDEIGMFWDKWNSRFGFSVLVRAPQPIIHR